MAVTNVGAPGPSVHAFAITPSDTTVFSATTKVWIGGAGGTMTALFNGDTVPVLLSGIVPGTILEISVIKVMATGTAATLIVGMN